MEGQSSCQHTKRQLYFPTECPVLSAPEYGSFSFFGPSEYYQNMKYSVVEFECQQGYDLLPATSRYLVCQLDGTWSGEVPVCRRQATSYHQPSAGFDLHNVDTTGPEKDHLGPSKQIGFAYRSTTHVSSLEIDG